MSTAYHPQIDGQIEVVNKCLKSYLRCFASKKPNQWAQWFPLVEWWHNTTYHVATKMTPYGAVYGPNLLSMASYIPSTSKVDAVDRKLCTREAIIHTLKNNLVMAQNRMKQQVD